MLSALLWIPLAFGLLTLVSPRRLVPWVAGLGAMAGTQAIVVNRTR